MISSRRSRVLMRMSLVDPTGRGGDGSEHLVSEQLAERRLLIGKTGLFYTFGLSKIGPGRSAYNRTPTR
jgi:hypothetical protein